MSFRMESFGTLSESMDLVYDWPAWFSLTGDRTTPYLIWDGQIAWLYGLYQVIK